MYSPKRKIREDKYLITYILSIHDVCEEVFKDSYIGRATLRSIKSYRYVTIRSLLVFVQLDKETKKPVDLIIQISGDYSSRTLLIRTLLTRRKFKRYCTAFDIMKDIDQLILTMNLIGDNSLNYLG